MVADRLGGLDAAFLAIETKAMHLHVAAVLILEPPDAGGPTAPTAEQIYTRIREAVGSRLERVPVLRRRFVEVPFGLGRPFVVDQPDVDLGAHVRRAALPQPGTAAQLERVVADIVSRPLDRSRPLWDLVVVEGLEDGRTAVVVRLHHAIADGIAGIGVLTGLLDPGDRVHDGSVPDGSVCDSSVPGDSVPATVCPATVCPATVCPATRRFFALFSRTCSERWRDRLGRSSGGSGKPGRWWRVIGMTRAAYCPALSTRRTRWSTGQSLLTGRWRGPRFPWP